MFSVSYADILKLNNSGACAGKLFKLKIYLISTGLIFRKAVSYRYTFRNCFFVKLFHIGINQIIEGNCVEVMKKFDSNSIDLTITSPPYDNLRTYKGYKFPFKEIAKELYRITKDGGIVVWVVNDATINGSETGTSFEQALFFKEIGFNLHDTMIFQKQNPIPQIYRKRYNNIFEYMFVFSKGVAKTHNPIKIDCLHAGLKLNGTTYKNYSKDEQKREKMAKPVKQQKIKGNIWEYVVGKKAEDQEAKGHPAPFPCALARDHIESWTK